MCGLAIPSRLDQAIERGQESTPTFQAFADTPCRPNRLERGSHALPGWRRSDRSRPCAGRSRPGGSLVLVANCEAAPPGLESRDGKCVDRPVVRSRNPGGHMSRHAVVAGLAASLLLSACGQGAAPMGPIPLGSQGGGMWAAGCAIPADFVATDTVNITGGLVVPQCVFTSPGTPVRFVNHDSVAYTFTSDGGVRVSFEVPANGSFTTPPITQGTNFACPQLANTIV